MKVLYIGSERSEAQTIASALRGVDEAISVLWAAQLENAANWLGESRGLDALVMEAPIDGASCLVVLKQLRRLALPPVVVFIVPDGIAPTLDSLHPGAHYVRRNQFLSRDLPIVVTRAIEREARQDLERKLAQTDKLLAEQQAKYDIGMARAEANWEMVDEQLRTAALQVELARQNAEAAGADVERLSRRETELTCQLADAAAAQDALEGQLADARSAIRAANELTEQERVAAATRLSDQQREFEARIAQATDDRRDVEARLAEASRAREDAEQRLATATSHVAQLTAREEELNELLAEITTSRSDLEGKLAATEAAFEDAVSRATRERLASSKRAAEREAELDGQIRRERATREGLERELTTVTGQLAGQRATRDALERHLADARSALDTAAAREVELADSIQHARESAAADIERFAEREAQLTSQLADMQTARQTLERQLADARSAIDAAGAREADLAQSIQHERETRVTLEGRLANTDAALEQAGRDYQSAAAEIERLKEREALLTSQLRDVQTAGQSLERELADARGALDAAAARETELVQSIQHERKTRATVEERLANTDAALEQIRQDHQSAAADVERLKEREAILTSQLCDMQTARHTLERELADARGALDAAAARAAELAQAIQHERETRATVEDRLANTAATLEQVRQDHQSAATDVERLTAREALLTSQLCDVQTARQTLERELADAKSALDAGAAREAELAQSIQQERETRATLEQTIADAEAAHRAAQQQHEVALAAAAAESATREDELGSQLADVHATRDALERQLAEADATLERVRQDYQSAAADVERLKTREAELDTHLQQEQSARAALEQTLAEVRFEFDAARLDIERLTGSEAELATQLANAQAVRDAAEQTLIDTRARFVEQRQQLEIQLAQEQRERESHSERNRTLTLERDNLQQSLSSLQDRTRQLQQSLAASVDAFEVSRLESQRLFDHAGVAMFRCTRDGALTDANRACTTLVGRRTLDELERIDFAAAVFEAPQALSWLIERCVSTRAKESIETTWRRQDGSRLFMRLSARSLASGMIEVVAEDLTRLRVLEERLGQAHRMEAVGRLASEVATTCSSLLGNIQQQGREWLMTAAADPDSRQRGELLFDDIGRAVGFLQELAACSDEQARTPMLVDLNTLVRDLEPVLKNVVGGEVEVQLRDTSTPLNVDVGTERIERLLVNLASYGRGRMPAGSRLRIELGTSVVDRHFSAKHPNVRLGLHALITVTESRRAKDDAQPTRSQRRAAARPGVDFATLQELVSDCGGHLWMKVHPLGEMVAKIRLPLFSPQDQRASRALSARGGRERQTARWFQS